jgi:hypothetical protein
MAPILPLRHISFVDVCGTGQWPPYTFHLKETHGTTPRPLRGTVCARGFSSSIRVDITGIDEESLMFILYGSKKESVIAHYVSGLGWEASFLSGSPIECPTRLKSLGSGILGKFDENRGVISPSVLQGEPFVGVAAS